MHAESFAHGILLGHCCFADGGIGSGLANLRCFKGNRHGAINAWMASQVLAGLDPATRTWHDWQPEVLNHFLCAALLPALHLGWNTLQ